MMSSVWPTIVICAIYVFICKIAGPWWDKIEILFNIEIIFTISFRNRFMRNREPYEIKHVIIAYNLFQTLFSLWGFTEGWK